MVSFMKSNIDDLLTLSKINVNARKISEIKLKTNPFSILVGDSLNISNKSQLAIMRQIAYLCPVMPVFAPLGCSFLSCPSNECNCMEKWGTFVCLDSLSLASAGPILPWHAAHLCPAVAPLCLFLSGRLLSFAPIFPCRGGQGQHPRGTSPLRNWLKVRKFYNE